MSPLSQPDSARNPRSHSINIRQWRQTDGVEPTLRVGIILDHDDQALVRLRLAAEPRRLQLPESPEIVVGPLTEIEIRLADRTLAVRIGDEVPFNAPSLRLSPASGSATAAQPGAGVLVRDVVAGRGFHWHKRIDQTLAGTLEYLPGSRGVVLINELPLEDYLAGVITAEMSGACPADLLKAQGVVARSWLLAMTEPKHDVDPFDRCNDDCCQRYQGTGDLSLTALDAVQTTRGLVLLDPAGNVLDANYAKSCGGVSELPRHVWGIDKPGISAVVDAPPRPLEHRFLPITDSNLDDYLDGRWLGFTRIYCSPNVVSPDAIGRYLGRVDEAGDYFRWTVRYERGQLETLLREKLPEARELAELRDLRVLARGVSGRVSSLELTWLDRTGKEERTTLASEYRIREVLHRKFLYSSAFAVRIERDLCTRQALTRDPPIESVTLRGAGWGHGVGLCQIGALGMALSGIDHEAICRHYYPEARLETVYE